MSPGYEPVTTVQHWVVMLDWPDGTHSETMVVVRSLPGDDLSYDDGYFLAIESVMREGGRTITVPPPGGTMLMEASYSARLASTTYEIG